MTSRISDHFTWDEATITLQRDPATGLTLPNQPDPDTATRLVHTFQQMEKVRALLGKPIVVHSAYRSPAVNAAVGGAKQSQHMRGEAVDFHVADLTIRETFEQLRRSDLRFDQLIEEAATWVHVSFNYAGPQRHQALTMRIVDGRAHYEPVA